HVCSRIFEREHTSLSVATCPRLSARSIIFGYSWPPRQPASRLLKNAGTSSFRGAGSAREPGIQEHGPEKSIAWPVFMGSGPGPDGPSRNDTRGFQHPARDGLAGDRVSLFAALLLPRRHPHPNPPPSR